MASVVANPAITIQPLGVQLSQKPDVAIAFVKDFAVVDRGKTTIEIPCTNSHNQNDLLKLHSISVSYVRLSYLKGHVSGIGRVGARYVGIDIGLPLHHVCQRGCQRRWSFSDCQVSNARPSC